MENDSIIDATEVPIDSYQATISWWERKRIWYNAVGLVAIILAAAYTSFTGEISSESEIGPLLFWGILLCNFCFTLGWAGELLLRYWLNLHPFPIYFRWILFIAGSLFTAFVTFVVWVIALGFFMFD